MSGEYRTDPDGIEAQDEDGDTDPSVEETENDRSVSNEGLEEDDGGESVPSALGSEGGDAEAAAGGPLEQEPAEQFDESRLEVRQEELLSSAEAEDASRPPYLLDAWYAEYADPSTEALLRRELREKGNLDDMLIEVVIGTDDRVRIQATRSFPWRAICSLLITARDGSRWIGTGWLISPRTLITAGHVVFIHSRGGWVRSIDVIPGRNGADRPFGTCAATAFRSVRGWTQSRLRDFDYGAIILPTSCPVGGQVGTFGFANLTDQTLRDLTVNLSGYPGDKPPGTQWWHARRLTQVTPRTIVYNIDSAGGQSGSPVWRLRNGLRHAVGIHTNGSLSGNSATRINRPVFRNLTSWRQEGV